MGASPVKNGIDRRTSLFISGIYSEFVTFKFNWNISAMVKTEKWLSEKTLITVKSLPGISFPDFNEGSEGNGTWPGEWSFCWPWPIPLLFCFFAFLGVSWIECWLVCNGVSPARIKQSFLREYVTEQVHSASFPNYLLSAGGKISSIQRSNSFIAQKLSVFS